MCGIVGSLTAPLPAAEAARAGRLVARMADVLRHRGPDGEGLFSDSGAAAQVHLGHRRLSILDPSPAGAQPMSDHSGRYTLVYNGAIYNFVELAEELRRRPGAMPFRGHSDTEVLCEAWAAWGPGCLSRINGMFAFAVWDRASRTLSLCRDRFGKKPLYYSWLGEPKEGGGTRLLFASEQKALFVHPQLAARPDRRLLAEFLRSHTIDHDEESGSFEGVLQVPPSGLLQIQPGSPPRLSRYFQIEPVPPGEQLPLSEPLIQRTRELLTDATAIRLRSDVPIGGTLSGGLDSSLLSGIVAGPLFRLGRLKGPYRVFLSQFPGSHEDKKGDESPWAERMLSSLPADAVVPLRSRPGLHELGADLEDVLYHQEEPFGDSSICAHYALMRVIKHSGTKVVLTGQGADEMFGGYVSYYYTLLGDLLAKRRPLEALRAAAARSQVFGEATGRLLAGGLYHAAPGWLKERLYLRRIAKEYPLSRAGLSLCAGAAGRYAGAALPDPRFGLLDGYLLDCVRRFALPHILRQDDRNAMAFGIESRAPYLDYRLAELAFRTQPTARLGRGYTKLLLREAARGLMPEDVRLRPDKMGFWSPQRKWLLENEALVRDVAGTPPGAVAELTDLPVWRASLDDFFQRRRYELVGRVWGGFLSSLWVRRTVPRMQAHKEN